MATELVSRNRNEAVVIVEGFFYHISKEGNVVRFKPGRKKKEVEVAKPAVVENPIVGVATA